MRAASLALSLLCGCVEKPTWFCAEAPSADNGTVTFDSEPACSGQNAMLFRDHCYDVREATFTNWAAAGDDCAMTGGYLATASDAAENDKLLTVSANDAWIGAQQLAGASRWQTGEAVDFTRWTSSGDGCAQLAPAGWGAVDCVGGSRRRICETPGWTRYEGHDYRFFFANLSWAAARADCETRNAVLAVITSECERDFVSGLGPFEHTFWLGGQKVAGGFTWIDGEAFSFAPFAASEPAGAGTCLLLDAGSNRWHDENCMALHGYVCERAP